jgi:hypothetical protein
MENASRAFLDAVRKSMRQIRTVIGATTIDPKLLTAAERLQYEGYLRREETNAAIDAAGRAATDTREQDAGSVPQLEESASRVHRPLPLTRYDEG